MDIYFPTQGVAIPGFFTSGTFPKSTGVIPICNSALSSRYIIYGERYNPTKKYRFRKEQLISYIGLENRMEGWMDVQYSMVCCEIAHISRIQDRQIGFLDMIINIVIVYYIYILPSQSITVPKILFLSLGQVFDILHLEHSNLYQWRLHYNPEILRKIQIYRVL